MPGKPKTKKAKKTTAKKTLSDREIAKSQRQSKILAVALAKTILRAKVSHPHTAVAALGMTLSAAIVAMDDEELQMKSIHSFLVGFGRSLEQHLPMGFKTIVMPIAEPEKTDIH